MEFINFRADTIASTTIVMLLRTHIKRNNKVVVQIIINVLLMFFISLRKNVNQNLWNWLLIIILLNCIYYDNKYFKLWYSITQTIKT